MTRSSTSRRAAFRTRLVALVLPTVIITAALTSFQAPACGDDWPTYLHDNARSGWTKEKLELPLTQRWVFKPTHPPEKAWPGPRDESVEGNWEKDKVAFDDANHVSVVGESVYMSSSGDSKVYCLDAATGAIRWTFITGGPVRLAPTVWNGRAFFGSDDGHVYCLGAADGELIWSLRAGPSDARLLGNGHMISRWPVRTGVVLDDGVAYFGAGVFPHEGVFICAASAEDGRLLWCNDSVGNATALAAGYKWAASANNSLSPQGYLLASETTLFVPSARALPAAFDRKDGHMLYQAGDSWRTSGIVGGTYALLAADHILVGANQAVGYSQDSGRGGFAWFPCRRLVVAQDAAYMATDAVPTQTDGPALTEEVSCLDFEGYAEASRQKKALERALRTPTTKLTEIERGLQKQRAKDPDQQDQQLIAQFEKGLAELQAEIDSLNDQIEKVQSDVLEPQVKWQTPRECSASLILAGDVLFAGGQDLVIAFDNGTGKELWRTGVEGRARGLAAAGGALYVSTDTGMLYCFGQGGPQATVPVLTPRAPDPYFGDAPLAPVYEAAADAIVKHSGITRGYCLILGCETGRLAYELARRTKLKISCIEPDMDKVQAARRALDAAGVYGGRVVVDQGDPADMPYSNYFANLIVSETALHTGRLPEATPDIVRKLKPCGGVICMGRPDNASEPARRLTLEAIKRWMDGLGLGAWHPSTEGGLWVKLERGPLPGAGSWTHQYADAGNTTCGNDELVRCPLGLLWYGDPGPDKMQSRHRGAAAPLAINGRMFVQGIDVLMCYDAYNGLKLWERDMPGATRGGQYFRTSNLAANDDSFFAAVGGRCLRLDQVTGETTFTYEQPGAGPNPPIWGYLACVDGLLYGGSSQFPALDDEGRPVDYRTGQGQSVQLFALDLESGTLRWLYQPTGKIRNLTISIGDSRVFFAATDVTDDDRQQALREKIEAAAKLTGPDAELAQQEIARAEVVRAHCLDAATGAEIWSRPLDVSHCGGMKSRLMTMYRDGVLLFCGAEGNGHNWHQFLGGEYADRRIVALAAQDGSILWQKACGYRVRPLIVGDTVVAEPWGFDLHTGDQKMRTHPLTGEQVPWQFERPGHHCGCIAASENVLFFRSGFTAFYDLIGDYGTTHFGATRPGCWINFIAAGGLVLIPEAASGCQCLYSVYCTVVLEPRETAKAWGIFSSPGPHAPIQQMALNLGAPGDRRDAQGTLWLAYPRPFSRMPVALNLKPQILEGCGYFSHNTEAVTVSGTHSPWIFSSGCAGLTRLSLPLLGPGQEPSAYTVRLHFAETSHDRPGQRVFDVKLQGKTVLEDFDIVQAAGGPMRAVMREFQDIQVQRNLEVELVPHAEQPMPTNAPLLNAIEVSGSPLPRMQKKIGSFAERMEVYNLGYWYADWLREATGADLALVPRAALWVDGDSYRAGDVTLGKLLAWLNDVRLVVYTVEGRELLSYLTSPGVTDRFNPYYHTKASLDRDPLYYSGFRVVYDPATQKATFGLDPGRKYTLLTIHPFAGELPLQPTPTERAQELAGGPGLAVLDAKLVPETSWELIERAEIQAVDFSRAYPNPLPVWDTWKRQFEAARSAAVTEWPEDKPHVVLDATADGLVRRSTANTRYGGDEFIGNDGGNAFIGDDSHTVSYLRFRLEVPGKPIVAKLRLHVSPHDLADSKDAGDICLTEEPWEESRLHYNGRPFLDQKVGHLGAVQLGKVEERLLQLDLQGRIEVSLALNPTTTDGASFYSRESDHPPQLIVAYEPE